MTHKITEYSWLRRLKIVAVSGFLAGTALTFLLASTHSNAGNPVSPSLSDAEEQTETMTWQQPEQDAREQAENLNETLARVTTGDAGQENPSAPSGSEELTIIPELQKPVEDLIMKKKPLEAAFVAVDPRTGEILALVGYSNGKLNNFRALEATGPAASIFKIVTSAAVLETTDVNPEDEYCYRGGKNGVSLSLLNPNEELDRACESFAMALGNSTNVIFGRLADTRLSPTVLDNYAHKFFFNRRIPFYWPVEISQASAPKGREAMANMAAGFRDSSLSPLHGALIAGAIANQGVMMSPRIVKSVVNDKGERIAAGNPTPLGAVVSAEAASDLTEMMMTTTTRGTASKYFRVPARSPLNGISIAGKTGSLTGPADPDTGIRPHYFWFVGFAPAQNPQIAIAALAVNPEKWVLKAGSIAKTGLETYFRISQQQDGEIPRDPGKPSKMAAN